MLIDLTLKITPAMANEAQGNQSRSLVGHLGTHFDVMNKEFPLEYTRLKGVVFDVSSIREREVASTDLDWSRMEAGMFVAFYTGYIEQEAYGSRTYFAEHPQLADELIDRLLERGVSIIAVDCAGIRRGREHTPKDQLCADRGCFVIENLWNLKALLPHEKGFVANTYPMCFEGVTGLPCRVIAEVEDSKEQEG